MTTRRQFMISVPAAAAAFALADHLVLDVGPARAQQIDPLQGHFHIKGSGSALPVVAIALAGKEAGYSRRGAP